MDKKQKEEAAQAAKAKAISYLTKEGQSLKDISAELHQSTKVQRDNTLELLLMEKCNAAKSSAKVNNEKSLRDALISQQQEKSPINNSDSAKLPPNWERVLDESSKLYYYWNKSTNETTWTKPLYCEPNAVMSSSNVEWIPHIHPGTKQQYYVHSVTGEKSFKIPSSSSTVSNVADKSAPVALTVSNNSTTSNIAATIKPGSNASMSSVTKRKLDDVDPLDFLQDNGDGKRRDKMADSTAGGSLWQQRPYPAPGKIMKPVATTKSTPVGASIGPAARPL